MSEILTPKAVLTVALSNLTQALLRVVAQAGGEGVEIAALRRWYQALHVPVAMAEVVERKIVEDGMVTVSNERMYFVATAAHMKRLAATPANYGGEVK